MADRTAIYVDGFNLYNGCVKGTVCHWLDIVAMSQMLLAGHDITQVRYFTAIVSDRPDDPHKSIRQLTYHRALKTLPSVSIMLGKFTTHDTFLPLASSLKAPVPTAEFVQVARTEEKGSDVNLATWLLHDAHLDRFDTAAIVSNDSDLLAPIRICRESLGKRVGLLNPHKHPSKDMVKHVDFVKQIRESVLKACRLPDTLRDEHGTILCPDRWLANAAATERAKPDAATLALRAARLRAEAERLTRRAAKCTDQLDDYSI